jgi:peptidyl-prolyl cis-trans isomerase SurA
MGEAEAGGSLGGEMTFDDFTTCRSLLVAAMIVITSTPAGLALAQTVGAVADSEPITELEIQQRSRLTEQSTRKTPAREEVIDELRKEKLKVQEAREFGVEVSDSEVDQAYANMASRMLLTSEQLTGQLARSGINADTVKHRIRADMAWGKYKQRQRLDPPLLRQQDTPLRHRQDPLPYGRDNG